MALARAATAAGLVGLAIGSFLGVLVLRMPQGRPVAMARSACPHCGRVLGPGELIPVVSWLVQRRRCRGWGTKLAVFCPGIELSAAGGAGWAEALPPRQSEPPARGRGRGALGDSQRVRARGLRVDGAPPRAARMPATV